MKLQVSCYENGDHTCVLWFPADMQPIENCLGFAIRKKRTGDANWCYLRNYVGFDGYQPDPPAPGDEWKTPFQRFLWWDYSVRPGEEVAYQIVPVLGKRANPRLDEANASEFTKDVKVTGEATRHISAYFNKGIIAAQWVSRELAQKAAKGAAQQTTMRAAIETVGDPLRDALGGLLRDRIVAALDGVQAQGGSIYAALYELNDPELIDRLEKLGTRVNLILANGAFKSGEPDENKAIRASLRKLNTVHLHDRLVSSGHFAHNKFVVFCDASGVPQTVLTGSTNWTVTGLCTQANNALFIEDQQVAKAFKGEWDRLFEAGNAYPTSLVEENSKQQQYEVDGVSVTTWFAPTSDQQDMAQARTLIRGAKDGVLFLFFNPGRFSEDESQETLLQTVLEKKRSRPGLYLRGVVNQKIAGLTDGTLEAPTGAQANEQAQGPAYRSPDEQADEHDPNAATAPVLLYGETAAAPKRAPKDVLVPAAIKKTFAGWEQELLSMGVMVHSKVVVIDPFGANPVVMTGSHNLGAKASRANDDNLVILQGVAARSLAISYAVNIIAIYQEYRWRTYVAEHANAQGAWHGLQDDDKWQAGHLTGDRPDLEFWCQPAGPDGFRFQVQAEPAPRPKSQTVLDYVRGRSSVPPRADHAGVAGRPRG